MGNWKKRNAAKRQRTLENLQKQADDDARPQDGGAAALDFSTLELSADLLQELRVLPRYQCCGCQKFVPLFCARCLTLHPQLWRLVSRKSNKDSNYAGDKCNEVVGPAEGAEEGGEQRSRSHTEADHPGAPGVEQELFFLPRLPVLPTSDFEKVGMKLHVICHPGEKLQKSSVAGLKFLCEDYYDKGWITPDLEGSATTRLLLQKNGAASREDQAFGRDGVENLPWFSTSVFTKKTTSRSTKSDRLNGNESPSMFASMDDFFRCVRPERCVLLYPEDKDAEDGEVCSDNSEDDTCTSGDINTSKHKRRGRSQSHQLQLEHQTRVALLLDCTWFQTKEILDALPRGLQRLGVKRRKTLFWRHHGRVQDQGLTENHLSTVEAAYFLMQQIQMAATSTSTSCTSSTTSMSSSRCSFSSSFDPMLLWFVHQWSVINDAKKNAENQTNCKARK